MLPHLGREHFSRDGFFIVRCAFDAVALGDELDAALRDGCQGSTRPGASGPAVGFVYVPMMTSRTPTSLALLDHLESAAIDLLGGPVLPTRAKGVLYTGDTAWHADSELNVPSIGFAAYLDPLEAATGALRVVPGSHRSPSGALARASLAALGGSAHATALPGHVLDAGPGDVIAFDEHLLHASCGGAVRRQWRLDFLRDPSGPEEEAQARAYFAGIFPPAADRAYDAMLFPSYGPDWQASGRRSVARLGALGVYGLAAGR